MPTNFIRQPNVTASAVERNVISQRRDDQQRREFLTFADESNKLQSAANALAKVETRRQATHQQHLREEQLYSEKVEEERKQQRLHSRVIAQNQALATELDRQAVEEERRRREIQRICEDSIELRELERALKIAYLNKERAAQQEERILLAQKEQERIQAMEDQMEYERVHAIKQETEKVQEKKIELRQQSVVLRRQIAEKQEELDEMKRQKEMDKDMVDEIVRRINEEDQADYMRQKELQTASAAMIRAFEEQRLRAVEAAQQAAREEEDKINEYNRSMQARNEGIAAIKQAKRDEEGRILEQLTLEAEKKRKEEEEFISLRDMLWEEELEAKRTKDYRDKVEKQARMKKEMMEVNERMLQAKEEMRRLEASKEARMVEMMRAKFAEDERKEREEEQSRRLNKQRYMSSIEQQRMERRSMFDRERQQEAQVAEEERRREEYRLQVIREARSRLLAEHAARLQEFLPPGVFNNTEELQQYSRPRGSR